MLVTAINLLPIGQLDGGHIFYGLFPRKQPVLGYIALAGLFFLGFWVRMWWVMAAIGIIFKVYHPPTLNDDLKPEPHAIVMGFIAIMILVVSFTPIPFRF